MIQADRGSLGNGQNVPVQVAAQLRAEGGGSIQGASQVPCIPHASQALQLSALKPRAQFGRNHRRAPLGEMEPEAQGTLSFTSSQFSSSNSGSHLLLILFLEIILEAHNLPFFKNSY